MTLGLSIGQTRMLRMRAQGLLAMEPGRQDDPLEILTNLVGVQAQDLNAGRQSLRVRGDGLTLAQIDAAQNDKRSVAWTWCLRGTLHLLKAEDAAWMVPFLGPRFIAGDRGRMLSLGWDEASIAAGLRLLDEALNEHGELSRAQIVTLLELNALPSAGQAPAHLIFRAALEGRLCCKPGPSGKTNYAPSAGWIVDWLELPEEEALSRLSRRYLKAYAPAGPADMAAWAGISLGQARQAFRLIGAELISIEAAGQPTALLREQESWLDERSPFGVHVCLLPRYDTLWMGYARRELWAPEDRLKRIFPGGGMIHPAVLVDGQVVGLWRTRQRKGGLEVQVEPFEALPPDVQPLLQAEAEDMGRFLGQKASLALVRK